MTQETNSAGLEVPFYPFLIAIAPVVSLYAINSASLGVLDVIRAALVYLTIAVLAVLTCRVASKHFRAAAVLASLAGRA